MHHNILDLVGNINGTTFASIDTTTEVKLSKKMSTCVKDDQSGIIQALLDAGVETNPFCDKIFKHTSGTSVLLFSNSKTNGYENMVKRRLEQEGKDKESFKLSPPVWGERIKDTPIITHNGEYYLEVILQHSGDSSYVIKDKDNFYKHIDKDLIFGLPKTRENSTGQGGIENKVMICRYKLKSITGIRCNNQSFTGGFYYEEV